MDQNLLKEIHYLTRLIEQHKKNSSEKSHQSDKIFLNRGSLTFTKSEKCTSSVRRSQQAVKPPIQESYSSAQVKRPPTGTNVYVNPNFKPQNPVIHINPKIRMKPQIHVNPKMMKDVAASNDNLDVKSVTPEAPKPNVSEVDVKRSVYVNPKLMKKLSSAPEPKPAEDERTLATDVTRSVRARLKFVRGTNTPKKINNSSVIILSKRKLVRIRRGSRGSSGVSPIGSCKVRKLINSPFRKTKVTPHKIVKTKVVDAAQQQARKESSYVKPPVVKPKINKYRIDRTVTETAKIKRRTIVVPKKTMNNTMELVTIGGIVYKSSKNQLVRRSYGLKKKRLSNVKTDRFIIATNGKKLHRLKSAKESRADCSASSTTAGARALSNVPQKVNYKTNISNKVKQRSIQILRNKMRKNNQPCLIFQRFGYCANHAKGTCSKLHDKKQVSLCKKFLQGNCLLDKCPLSHDVGPEKMPTCKYFLEGCCTRDACPYRHVKVSSKTPICIEFLQGYCAKGHECERRHENLCPEFEKTGRCSKGKYCPYPHKTHSSTVRRTDKYLKRKHGAPSARATTSTDDRSASTQDGRLRYYEQADTLNEDIDRKREVIMKKMRIMKNVEVTVRSLEDATSMAYGESNTVRTGASEDESELQVISETKAFKRPPIGSLPAYIPIN